MTWTFSGHAVGMIDKRSGFTVLVFYGYCNKVSGIEWLKTMLICFVVLGVTVWNGSQGWNQGVSFVSSGGSRGESMSLPFPACRSYLHPLAPGPVTSFSFSLFSFIPLMTSSKPSMTGQGFLTSYPSDADSAPLLHFSPTSTFKQSCDHIVPTQIIQDNLSISRSPD